MRRQIVPTFGTLVLAALLAAAVWGVRWEVFGTAGHANADGAGETAWRFEPALVGLELSEEQASRIEGILGASVARMQRLEAELREAERALRVTAGSPSFDEELAGRIVRHRAELSAYLWGTEARVESQVYQTLTPEQRLAYSEQRALEGRGGAVQRVAYRGD